MKEFLLATEKDSQEIFELVQTTINEIYPKYYLKEIIDMFIDYHNIDNICKDISEKNTYILLDDGKLIGTATADKNHIKRVYVWPKYQKQGYGTYIMRSMEQLIKEKYSTASIDASLPACRLYDKLGYKLDRRGIWECANGVIQVYDIMEKVLRTSDDGRLRLRPYKAMDAEIIAGWIKDEASLRRWSSDRFGDYPITAEDINHKYLECNGDCEEPDNFYPMTAVYDGAVVGHLILRYTGEDTIRFGFVIVDDSLRGRGFGKKMLSLATEYAANMLGAKKITLGVFNNNPEAYFCYKAAGFKEILMNQEIILDMFGEKWKIIEMDKEMDGH